MSLAAHPLIPGIDASVHALAEHPLPQDASAPARVARLHRHIVSGILHQRGYPSLSATLRESDHTPVTVPGDIVLTLDVTGLPVEDVTSVTARLHDEGYTTTTEDPGALVIERPFPSTVYSTLGAEHRAVLDQATHAAPTAPVSAEQWEETGILLLGNGVAAARHHRGTTADTALAHLWLLAAPRGHMPSVHLAEQFHRRWTLTQAPAPATPALADTPPVPSLDAWTAPRIEMHRLTVEEIANAAAPKSLTGVVWAAGGTIGLTVGRNEPEATTALRAIVEALTDYGYHATSEGKTVTITGDLPHHAYDDLTADEQAIINTMLTGTYPKWNGTPRGVDADLNAQWYALGTHIARLANANPGRLDIRRLSVLWARTRPEGAMPKAEHVDLFAPHLAALGLG